MLGRTDQIEVLAFDLVHHSVHLSEGHNAGYDRAADHERRNVIIEALTNHEVSCIGENRGVESRDVAHQIIEAVACNLSR